MFAYSFIGKKYKQDSNVIYYSIHDQLDESHFMIGIDRTKKELSFYRNDLSTGSIVSIIKLETEGPINTVPGINKNVALMLAAKALQYIRNENFPEEIHFISH